MKYIAFATKGLENICKKELLTIPGIEIVDIKQKYILFNYLDNPSFLKNLRTIDDIAIFCNEFNSQDLITGRFKEAFNFENFNSEVIDFLKNFRQINQTFSLTVSIYKNNNIFKDFLKDSISSYIKHTFNLEYSEFDHTNIDFRINIEEEKAISCIKLFPHSLYKREYKHKSTMGSIRSTIASALIFNLDPNKDFKLVDNFCGSGTILCEALNYSLEVFGGDIKEKNIKIAKENLEKLNYKKNNLKVQNASKTIWRNNSFDIAVSNFPWNKQIKTKNFESIYKSSLEEYKRILKENAKLAFIGIKPDILKKYIKEYWPEYKIEEFKIGYLGQSLSLIFAFPQ